MAAIQTVSASSRYAAIVIEERTGRVLFSAADKASASLTKIMTLYMVF